ncbi:MAG TPA: SRPBCC family protein [Candidatus Koribacter sp.]|jgi:uncharacterized membrane protein
MEQRSFWSGFIAGVGMVAGSWAALQFARRGGMSPIVRLEKSIQIGAPLEDVFGAWANFRLIPQHVRMVKEVRVFGTRTHWRVLIANAPFEWDAEITQLIPHQAIGWKSLAGPKHSGRITFAPLGNDTLVHVHMNYVPAGRLLRPMFASFAGEMEGFIEQSLREFKTSMESGGTGLRREQNTATPTGAQRDENRASATGTYGPGPELASGHTNPKHGAPEMPVEFTRPPEAKY